MRRAVLPMLLLGACGSSPPGTEDPPPPDLAPTCLPGLPDAGASFPDPKCPVEKPAPDTFDDALGFATLDRCTASYATPRARDPWRLPWYDTIHDHALRAPPMARGLVAQLDTAAASTTPVADALTLAGSALGAALAPCVAPPDPPLDPARPLADAIERLAATVGGTVDPAALDEDAADVPTNLQAAVAEIVLAAADAELAWRTLAKPLSEEDLDTLSRTSTLALGCCFPGPDMADPKVRDLLAARFDQRALVEGAIRLAFSVERARLARFAGASGFAFDQKTPIGRIVLRDAGAHTWNDDPKRPILLAVDTGGDDTYRFPAGATDGAADLRAPRHVGLAIDLAGADRYGYVEEPHPQDGKRLPSDGEGRGSTGPNNGWISLSETPRQGAGRMGYGMLFDLGPEGDRYRSLRLSQGYGTAGVGVLFDAGGDDTYEGEAGVQGSASFGVGILLDRAGNDTYRTYHQAQGFGYVRGVGFLHDGGGDDRYLGDTGDPKVGGDPIYPSPQLPCNSPQGVPQAMRTNCGNSSFTQGAGFGRRADFLPDKTSMSGGLGVLRDVAGDDVYTTSVFGQGTGYWYGTGILSDGAGRDSYDGKWYVQGATAHFALSLFLDEGGDDRYNQNLAPSATSIGVGHDLSVSWHIDAGGNDVYTAPGLSLGSGHANGMGFFVNLGGDDTYRAPGGATFGAATIGDADFAQRRSLPTVGVFLDVGGKDSYDTMSAVKPADGKSWPNNLQGMGYNNHGAGLDRADGTVSLP